MMLSPIGNFSFLNSHDNDSVVSVVHLERVLAKADLIFFVERKMVQHHLHGRIWLLIGAKEIRTMPLYPREPACREARCKPRSPSKSRRNDSNARKAAELFLQEYPARKTAYNVLLASTTRRRSVATSCGLVLAGTGTATFRTLRGPIDTLLVAGGSGVEVAARDEELLVWLQETAQRVRRIGSICTGAFLLASAGLLDAKRVATHWKWAAELANKFKHTTVDPDPIYIRDGNTYTSAGVTAGMDLALALVEEDLGAPTALKIAREMVLYLRRGGGQSQFSTALSLQASDPKTNRRNSFLDPRQSTPGPTGRKALVPLLTQKIPNSPAET